MTHSRTFAELKATLRFKVWDDMPLVLRSQMASGELPDGRKFTMDMAANNTAVYIKIDGQAYELGMRDVMTGLIDAIGLNFKPKEKASEQE